MANSSLFGRRIHITGSASGTPEVATKESIDKAREMLSALVPELIRRGATFVIPVDVEPLRDDGSCLCFDWLVWQALRDNIHLRPRGAQGPLAIAVQHHKTERQIPAQFVDLWDKLRDTDLVHIENATHWNMNSKRLEAAARWGEILITLGGTDGVIYAAELYHDAGKPVIPLPDELSLPDTGSLKLFAAGLSSSAASRLFRTTSSPTHAWMNRLNSMRATPKQRADTLMTLLEDLEPPEAFAVRLLDPSDPEFQAVDDYFAAVVKPVVEGEMGYVLRVIDGKQAYEQSRIDQEIFVKLRRARLVVADLTGQRPNCFLETGFAMGREIPTVVMCKTQGKRPFDLYTVATHYWDPQKSVEENKRLLREHFVAVKDRPVLSPAPPLLC